MPKSNIQDLKLENFDPEEVLEALVKWAIVNDYQHVIDGVFTEIARILIKTGRWNGYRKPSGSRE